MYRHKSTLILSDFAEKAFPNEVFYSGGESRIGYLGFMMRLHSSITEINPTINNVPIGTTDQIMERMDNLCKTYLSGKDAEEEIKLRKNFINEIQQYKASHSNSKYYSST